MIVDGNLSMCCSLRLQIAEKGFKNSWPHAQIIKDEKDLLYIDPFGSSCQKERTENKKESITVQSTLSGKREN